MQNSKISYHVWRNELDEVELLLSAGTVDLDEVQGRPVDPVLTEMEKNVHAKAKMLASLNRLRWLKDVSQSATATRVAKSLLASAQDRLTLLRDQVAKSVRPSLPVLGLVAVAVLIGISVELGLCATVLPALLGIRPDSILGILMGGLTLLLTVALEQLLDPQIRTLEGCLRERAGGRRQLAAQCICAVSAAAFGALNIFALYEIAMAREEAAKLIQALLDVSRTDLPQFNPSVVAMTVIWVGIATVVDCSLLLRILLHGLDTVFLRCRVARAEAAVARLHSEVLAAESKERIKRAWHDEADRHEVDLTSVSVSTDLAKLEEIRARHTTPPKMDLAAVVDDILSPHRSAGASLGVPSSGANAARLQ